MAHNLLFRLQIGQGVNMKKTTRNILIGLYVFFILGLSIVAKAEYHILPFPTNAKTSNFEGLVTQSSSGEFFLIIDSENEMYFQIYGSVDFEQFNGWKVKVIGIEQKMRKVGPVLSLQSLDPLQDNEAQEVVAPKLHVLSINGIAPIEQ